MKEKKKILIVEDDIDLGAEMEEFLQSGGYAADLISDPRQVEKTLRKGKYGVILMDYKMPHMDGAELVRRIRKKEFPVKIVVISGRPFIKKIFQDEGLEEEVSEFISKPFDFTELLQKIESAASSV